MRPIALASLLFAPAAFAFTLDTVATTGCHERITAAALERSGWPDARAAPAPTEEDRVLARNVQFRAPADADGWTLALVIGVRDNDLGGSSPSDLPHLAAVQNGTHHQHDHCLRDLDDSGEGADQRALAACRAYILEELEDALGDGEAPDLEATELKRVDLAFGNRDLALNHYAFHLGRASHAVEDGFAHTFRTDDFHTVVSVLNYIGPNLGEHYRPEVDGYAHQSSMDSCDEADPEASARTEATTTALAELYAALDAPGDRSARIAGADAVLDRWFGYSPGCSMQNAWCDHAKSAPSGCSVAGGAPLLALAAAGLLLRRRRAFTLAAALLATAAFADEAPVVVAPAPAAEVTPSTHPISLHFASGVSLDNPGFALTLGARAQLHRRFVVGLDVELAPWFDLISGRSSEGTFNAYASGSVIWASIGRFDVRTVAALGTSVMLFAAPGANRGSVGVFAGITLLQLIVHLGPQLSLELSPEIVVAVPSLKGVPLAYRQYRTSIGFQWAF